MSSTATEALHASTETMAPDQVCAPAGPARVGAWGAHHAGRSARGEKEERGYRYVDERGNEYRYTVSSDGTACIVDLVAHDAEVVVPPSMGGHRVTAIGREAASRAGRRDLWAYLGEDAISEHVRSSVRAGTAGLSRNGQLSRVTLPQGLAIIGRGAFRGCASLVEVNLPDSLERIDDLAFSCTGIRRIELPEACVQLTPQALRFGPESLRCADAPFASKLEEIAVRGSNARYRMVGSVLCRKIGENGELEAVLCPGKADEVRLDGPVVRVAEGAFAGTRRIELLAVCEGVELPEQNGLVARALCGQVRIVAGGGADGAFPIEVRMPEGELGHRAFDALRGRRAFETKTFLDAYDCALLEMNDRLEQAKLMLARLTGQYRPEQKVEQGFTELLEAEIEPLCVHFGARGYHVGFEQLASVGILDAGGIAKAVELLSARADASAVSYLLALKQSRYGEMGWDYDL